MTVLTFSTPTCSYIHADKAFSPPTTALKETTLVKVTSVYTKPWGQLSVFTFPNLPAAVNSPSFMKHFLPRIILCWFSLQVMAVLPFLLCWTPLHVLSFNMPAHSRVQSCPFVFSVYTSWVFSFSSRASHTVHVLGSSNVHLSPDLFPELHTHMSGPPFYISTWISNSISNCGPHQFLHLAHHSSLSIFPLSIRHHHPSFSSGQNSKGQLQFLFSPIHVRHLQVLTSLSSKSIFSLPSLPPTCSSHRHLLPGLLYLATDWTFLVSLLCLCPPMSGPCVPLLTSSLPVPSVLIF